jgi:hypothetical protein
MYNPIRQTLEDFDRKKHAHGEELTGAVRAALHNVVTKNSWLSALRKDEHKDARFSLSPSSPERAALGRKAVDADVLSLVRPTPTPCCWLP